MIRICDFWVGDKDSKKFFIVFILENDFWIVMCVKLKLCYLENKVN